MPGAASARHLSKTWPARGEGCQLQLVGGVRKKVGGVLTPLRGCRKIPGINHALAIPADCRPLHPPLSLMLHGLYNNGRSHTSLLLSLSLVLARLRTNKALRSSRIVPCGICGISALNFMTRKERKSHRSTFNNWNPTGIGLLTLLRCCGRWMI